MTPSHRPPSGQASAVPPQTGPRAVQDQIRRLREEGGTYRSIAAAAMAPGTVHDLASGRRLITAVMGDTSTKERANSSRALLGR